jgi:restriction system protein
VNASDNTFQYPPELLNLLIDAIPVLNRSKQEVLLFFRGAGVAESMFGDLADQLEADRESIGKYEIARTMLQRLNERGEPALRERREVLRRVTGFTNFDACWPNDRMKAKGLVASIREIVNQKDAFTRMSQERDAERQARLAEADKANRTKQERAARIDAARQDIYALFGASLTPQQRGKKLETSLNNLFAAHGILVRQAFHLVGEAGEGIVEQIDGVLELNGVLHFVEVKWYKEPVGVPEVSQHLVRMMSRAEARAIIISASDFTLPAIHTCREFLQQKLVALCHLQEIVHLLELGADLAPFLLEKVQAAQIHKNPYFRPLDTRSGTTGP